MTELTYFISAAAYPSVDAAMGARAEVQSAYLWNGEALDAVVVRRSTAGEVAIAAAPDSIRVSLAASVIAALFAGVPGPPGADVLARSISRSMRDGDRSDIREALLHDAAALLVVLEPECADNVRRAVGGSPRVVVREVVVEHASLGQTPLPNTTET
jgi:hypothetical protein